MMDFGLPGFAFVKLESGSQERSNASLKSVDSDACTDVRRSEFLAHMDPLLTRQIEHSMKELQPPRSLSGQDCGFASNSHAA